MCALVVNPYLNLKLRDTMRSHLDSTEHVVDMFSGPLLETIASKASLPASSRIVQVVIGSSSSSQTSLPEDSNSFRPQAMINDNSNGGVAASNSECPPSTKASLPASSGMLQINDDCFLSSRTTLPELCNSFRPQAKFKDNSSGGAVASSSAFSPDANTSVPDTIEVENSDYDFEPEDRVDGEIV